MLATLNRWIAAAVFVIGAGLAAIGLYLGAFAWLNDGLLAGLQLFGTTGAFGAGLAAAGLALRFAAAAHARRDPRRWMIQAVAIVAGYLAVGTAAWITSLLEDLGRR